MNTPVQGHQPLQTLTAMYIILCRLVVSAGCAKICAQQNTPMVLPFLNTNGVILIETTAPISNLSDYSITGMQSCTMKVPVTIFPAGYKEFVLTGGMYRVMPNGICLLSM